MPRWLAGMVAKDGDARTRNLLKLFDLEKRGVHRADGLSGGEQQRIAMATALANEPPFILPNEPTGKLDTKKGHKILELLGRPDQEFKKTVLVVTHDQRVADIAHRVLQIEDGKLTREVARPT